MAGATSHGQASNPVCGDLLHLYLKVEKDTIAAASFMVQGCPPSIAAGSALTEMVQGLSVEEARKLRPRDVAEALGGLPRNKEHCSTLAIDALRAALAEIPAAVV